MDEKHRLLAIKLREAAQEYLESFKRNVAKNPLAYVTYEDGFCVLVSEGEGYAQAVAAAVGALENPTDSILFSETKRTK